MTLFTRSLWPQSVRSPYTRLIIALLVAPGLIALVLGVLAFLIAGVSESSREDTLDYTLSIAPILALIPYVFTLTCGLSGSGILWATAQRGLLVWALAGGLLGALAGMLLGFSMEGGPNTVVLIAGAVLGWVLFTLIRRIAGVRDDPETSRISNA
jgi:hypothetical protein